MNLYEEMSSVIAALEAAGLEYALCGGLAVAFHGHPRFTKDIDILVREEDLDAVKGVIAPQGYIFDAGAIPFGTGTPQARVVHRVTKIEGREHLIIDLLLLSPALTEVWQGRETFVLDERPICVVSRAGLALMKRLAGRRQDLLDLENLGLLPEGEGG
jgi:hypothetical protein